MTLDDVLARIPAAYAAGERRQALRAWAAVLDVLTKAVAERMLSLSPADLARVPASEVDKILEVLRLVAAAHGITPELVARADAAVTAQLAGPSRRETIQ